MSKIKIEPSPTAIHNMADVNNVRLVGPHFSNGHYTLHMPNGTYHPNVTGTEALERLQELQDARAADRGGRETQYAQSN